MSITQIKPKTVYIKTFGCSLNQSDSEVMAGLLEQSGFNILSEYGREEVSEDLIKENVDCVIINTCSVKNLAESKFFKELRSWKELQKTRKVGIVIAGCIPQAEPELLQTKLKDVSVIGTRQLVHVVEIINDTLNGLVVQNIENDKNERLNLPKVRKTGIIEILPISEGCLSNCTYCKTKLARGNLLSYPKEKIIAQFKEALKEGCREFWLTSQDNGCYGFDIYRKEKYFLPQLLNDLANIDGEFKIRVGMSNPDHIDRIKNELVESFKHPKIFKFLHIPIQAGNNSVLKEMKRYYTIEECKNIIDLFKKEIPNIGISTDIIVGFPTETDGQFKDSLELLKYANFDVLNFSRFWLRKGTEAENLKQLPGTIGKHRAEELKKLFDELSEKKNKSFVGQTFNVLIDEVQTNKIIARNDSYKQIVIHNSNSIKDNSLFLGYFVNVKIIGNTKYDLIGEILN